MYIPMRLRDFFLVPTYSQWKQWSLPSKVGLVSFYVGLLGLVISVIPLFISSSSVKQGRSFYDAALNHVREGQTDEAIVLLTKAWDINPRDVAVGELLAEQLIVKNRSDEAKGILVSIKDNLSDDGKIMLAIMYFKGGKADLAYGLSGLVVAENASMKWGQHFYLLRANLLASMADWSSARDFMVSSISDLNIRIAAASPVYAQNNPYTSQQRTGGFPVIDYLQATSTKFALASLLASHVAEDDDAEKVRIIKAVNANYGYGFSRSGQFVASPDMAMVFVRKIFSKFNATGTIGREDVELAFELLKKINISLKGVIVFPLPVSNLTVGPLNTGVKKEEFAFVGSVVETFGQHYRFAGN